MYHMTHGQQNIKFQNWLCKGTYGTALPYYFLIVIGELPEDCQEM
jgi:hypothetical protein